MVAVSDVPQAGYPLLSLTDIPCLSVSLMERDLPWSIPVINFTGFRTVVRVFPGKAHPE